MNGNLKNILSFIKESLELKNKNIYRLSDYEIHEDLGRFYFDFKDIIDSFDYLSLNINSDGVVFKLKYIKDDKKKFVPEVPMVLTPYVFLKDNNDIISKVDDLEGILSENNLLNEYKQYDASIKDINRYNALIDAYNSKYMKFYNVYKRINDYEEKIEVIFGNKLMVWSDNSNNKIERYIFEANLEINVDPINNIINFLIDNEKFKGFVTDFLNLESYKIKDIGMFYDYVKTFNENVISTDFDVDVEASKYINFISLENEIVNDELKSNHSINTFKSYLFNNCGIIVRTKNVKLWIDDFDKIVSMCNSTEFESPLLNLFEVDFSNEEQVYNLLNDSTYSETKNETVLFPLASNEEQYKIVDKVKSSNIVLVQGPPGTGKSHTIANLLSHYISEGKRVIVTSEKAKALEVLRDKIPDKIRSLSLSLLTSTGVDKDLEFSINTVLKHQEDNTELDRISNRIAFLTDELKKIQLKKQETIQTIIDLMLKDTISYREKLNLIMEFSNDSNLTLMDIAIWLEKNQNYAIVPISDIENYEYSNPLEFFEKLDDICDVIKNNNYAVSTFVPINDKINNNDIELYIKERLGYKNYKVINSGLINAIKQSELNSEIIDKLGSDLDKMKKIYKYFDKNFVINNTKYEVFITKINEIINTIVKNKKFFILTEEQLFDYNVAFDDDSNLSQYLHVMEELLELYDDDGKLSFINKIKFNSIKKKLNGLTINKNLLQSDNTSKEFLSNIRDIITYYVFIDEIKDKMNRILGINLFEKVGIKKNQFGRYIDEIIEVLDGFVNFDKYVKDIYHCFNHTINKNLFSINYLECDENFVNGIYSDLKNFVRDKLSADDISTLVNEIRDFYKDYNLQSLINLLISIENNDLEDYKDKRISFLSEISIINKYNELKKKFSNLVNDKHTLIDNYTYKMNIDEKIFFKANIDRIFKYHYILKFYFQLEKKEKQLPFLYENRNQLINDEKKIVEELVATQGWYYQNIKMTPEISASLNRWINLKKKLGGGKGKNTNIILRQMREEMSIAKNAIPVWIMPIDKLIEQYPFTSKPPFDVLIMDESSQSSVFSISALARAKKIIIVGDDKQISPTNAFTSLDGINDLRAKYLKNNSWDLQISKDTSIYDIIQTICGNKKITLTEHFRCLPEIINYSNKTFYNNEINVLKVRGNDNTIELPIKTIYVPNAVCKRSGTQIINEAELNRIVTLIADISCDHKYDNKTIGIIALQNNMTKYIQKLTEVIMHKFGEYFINDRKIKIGITYDFQGDERDVIILSMGISSIYENGDRYSFRALTTQEFDRSFNVAASRAKEQMILVHSVKLDELSPYCNRYKLLNYCLNYNLEEEKETEELFESNFERDIYYCLISKGYKLTPQFKVGNYRIDFVLTNDSNQKIAIECDGDLYHGINELENDLKRQSILERCGWKFVRIRASQFYFNKNRSIDDLVKSIEHFLNVNNQINKSKEKLISSSKIDNSTLNYIDQEQNFNGNVISEYNESKIINSFSKDELKQCVDSEVKKIENNNKIKNLSSCQFKYMTLFSNNVSRKDIAEFYNVSYDTVKKSLQSICSKYFCSIAESCIGPFVEEYRETSEYKSIIKEYNDIIFDNCNKVENYSQEILELFDDFT